MLNDNASEQYRARIRTAAPELDVRTIEPLGAGNNNMALLVNGALVFRFARHAQAAAALERETALLRGLAGQMPLPVPEPLYAGEGFSAYTRIPGAPLTSAALRMMGEPDRQAIAKQLAVFLRTLHGIPMAELPEMVRTGEVSDTFESWADLCERIRARLLPLMRPEARAAVAEQLDAFLAALGSDFAFSPALRHGDVGPSNILYDPATNRLTGVIDFGSAGLGDPALDFAGSMFGPFGYGEQFLERLRSHYWVSAEAIQRARSYASTFALQEALIGAEQGDAEALRAGLAGYV